MLELVVLLPKDSAFFSQLAKYIEHGHRIPWDAPKNAIMKSVFRTTPSKSVDVWHQRVHFIKLPCGSYMLEFGNHSSWTIPGSSTCWHIQITWGLWKSWIEWAAVLSGHRAWASGTSKVHQLLHITCVHRTLSHCLPTSLYRQPQKGEYTFYFLISVIDKWLLHH